jgi:hypothetical protein
MTRSFSAITIALALTACSTDQSPDSAEPDATTATTSNQPKVDATNNIVADTTNVKTWLINVIEAYPNDEDPNRGFENLKKSLTDDYANYKQDAINLEYDSSDSAMTEADFNKKWQHKYNTEFVGNGGYIISGQDNGRIKVTRCKFLKNLGKEASLYKVRIEDLDFKATYNRDIKVVAVNNKLFIDDVVEYN